MFVRLGILCLIYIYVTCKSIYKEFHDKYFQVETDYEVNIY